MQKRTLNIVEIFRSIQGEGANMGKQATFIRLSHCNLSCWFCDTDFERGEELTLEEIALRAERLGCRSLIWTGGEPSLQLTEEVVDYFKAKGYWQSIETNGTKPIPSNLDYVCCSPKVDAATLRHNFKDRILDELRYPYGANEPPPPDIALLPKARHYFISPIFLGEQRKRMTYEPENLKACLDFMKTDERWRLSLQLHKFINIP